MNRFENFRPSIELIAKLKIFLFHSRQLPVYTKTANGATAIPLPATVLVTRRCPPDKVRPLPPTPNHQSCKLWSLNSIERNFIRNKSLPSQQFHWRKRHRTRAVDRAVRRTIRKTESGNKFQSSWRKKIAAARVAFRFDLKLNQAWEIFHIICISPINFAANAISIEF